MSNVSQWSTTASSNNSAPPDGAPEGMAANTVNDVIRENMAAIAKLYGDISGDLVTTGSSNAYLLTTNNAHAALGDQAIVVFRASFANTGACTLNVDSLGAKALKINDQDPASGNIAQDQIVIAVYNATNDVYDILGGVTQNLSSNVPLLSASNTFTGALQTISSASSPRLDVTDTTNTVTSFLSASDSAGFVGSLTNHDFSIRTNNQTRILIENDGAEIRFDATLFDFNGAADFSSTVGVNGQFTTYGTGTNPQVRWNSTDQATNEKYWIALPINGNFELRAYNDAINDSNLALSIQRTGFIIDEVELNATALDFNGAIDADGATHDINGSTSVTLTGGSAVITLSSTTIALGGNITVSGSSLNSGSASVTTSNDTADEVGFKGCPFNTQNGNYTLVLADAGKTIYKASGGAGETITIPANASVAFPVGTVVVIGNDGGGNLSIAITSDTLEQWGTGSTGTRTLADNGKAVLEKVAATTWKISGIGVS